jgi:hypothetical protein
LLYNFESALETHQTRLGSSQPSYSNSHVNHLLIHNIKILFNGFMATLQEQSL